MTGTSPLASLDEQSLLLRNAAGRLFLSHRFHMSHGFLRYCFGGLGKIV